MLKISLVISLLIYGSSFSGHEDETHSLKVQVKGLRNSAGVVQFALYDKTGTFPDEHYSKYYRLVTAEINNGSSEVSFRDVPAGNYAVNILHDENKNGKIDKGFILPREGIGFSNYDAIGVTKRPSFTKASFNLKADTTIQVKIIYF